MFIFGVCRRRPLPLIFDCSGSMMLPVKAALERVTMPGVIKLVPGAGVEPAQKFLSEGF